VLLLPVLLKSALTPVAVLKSPLTLFKSAWKPLAVLSWPVVFRLSQTTDGCVRRPGIVRERFVSAGCVIRANCVVPKSGAAYGRIVQTGGVELERPSTDGGVVSAECDAKERTGALSRIVVRIAPVRRWWR